MRAPRSFIVSILIFTPALAFAGDTEWRRYVDPEHQDQRRHAGLDLHQRRRTA